MNTKRSHARSPGKTQFSLAVDTVLMEQVASIAARERRTKNNMIQIMLEDAVRDYNNALALQTGGTESKVAGAVRSPATTAPRGGGGEGPRHYN